jgi:hypothetical protein
LRKSATSGSKRGKFEQEKLANDLLRELEFFYRVEGRGKMGTNIFSAKGIGKAVEEAERGGRREKN